MIVLKFDDTKVCRHQLAILNISFHEVITSVGGTNVSQEMHNIDRKFIKINIPGNTLFSPLSYGLWKVVSVGNQKILG